MCERAIDKLVVVLERGGISMVVQVGLLICMLRTSFTTFWLENYCKENK